tara:strand:+ start:1829 stop:2842 length:1014 start_codon:yes stop_codon:yes gene_type:complete
VRHIRIILILMTCASHIGCNRIGTYVASILPKKTAEPRSSFSNESFSKDGVPDDTIRPNNNSNSNGQDRHPEREGFLTAPAGERYENGYDQQEYQQMMGAGTADPSSQLDHSTGPSGAIPGNPEYGEGTLKHPNEDMIGVGGDEYRLFAEGGLKAPGSDMFSNMAANFYSGIDNANGEYASPVPQGLVPNATSVPNMPESTGKNPMSNSASNRPNTIQPKPEVGQGTNTFTSNTLVDLMLEAAVPRLGDEVQVMSFAFRYQQLTAERLEGHFFIVVNASNGGGLHAQPVKINGSGKFTVLTQLRPASRPFTAYLLMQQGERRLIISRQIVIPFKDGF